MANIERNIKNIEKGKRYLIINADDFGYFHSISKGILDCALKGVVTATGIIPNSPLIDRHIEWAHKAKNLDFGVHVTLTDGQPLTEEIKKNLKKWDGNFPGKMQMIALIVSGKITKVAIEKEIKAQIERCLSLVPSLYFINSHEHIHMLPPIYKIFKELSLGYNIPYLRYSAPQKGDHLLNFRDTSLKLLGLVNKKYQKHPHISLVGMSSSGKLNISYLRGTISLLKPGIHELMCHPGFFDDKEIKKKTLLDYHDWEGERNTLISDDFRNLLKKECVEVIRFSDLVGPII